jgi:hypothetical protein
MSSCEKVSVYVAKISSFITRKQSVPASCSHFTVCTKSNLQVVWLFILCSGNQGNYSIATLSNCITSFDNLGLPSCRISCALQLRGAVCASCGGRHDALCGCSGSVARSLSTCHICISFFIFLLYFSLFQISLILNLIPLTLI